MVDGAPGFAEQPSYSYQGVADEIRNTSLGATRMRLRAATAENYAPLRLAVSDEVAEALPFRPPPGLDEPSPKAQRKRSVTWGRVDVYEVLDLNVDMCNDTVAFDDIVCKPEPLPTPGPTLLCSQRTTQVHAKAIAHNDLPAKVQVVSSRACFYPAFKGKYAQPNYSAPYLTPVQASMPEVPTKSVDGDLTTVMLQNLPSCYDRPMLLELLDAQGFHGCYDFFYLPLDFKSGLGLGYAFVNFVTNSSARRAFDVFIGFRDWACSTNKVCEVIWRSKHQGLHNNLEVMRNSTVMHAEIPECFRPVLFRNGMRAPFPCPTKRISVARTVINSSKKCGMGRVKPQ